MTGHIQFGSKGEKIAALFLIKKGYTILYTNKKFNKAEIDIIAEKDNKLIIVEVKTRSSSDYGSPADAVGRQKQLLMIKAAETYLEENKCTMEVRYDVISIVKSNEKEIIEHIEEAFYPFSDLLDE